LLRASEAPSKVRGALAGFFPKLFARKSNGARNPACSANSARALPDGNRQLPESSHSIGIPDNGIRGMPNLLPALRLAETDGFWLLLMPVVLPAYQFGKLGGFH
jgi:hypothetical protein